MHQVVAVLAFVGTVIVVLAVVALLICVTLGRLIRRAGNVADRRRWEGSNDGQRGQALSCPLCGHPMAEHRLFPGNYEQPDPEVSCCSDEISPRTLTTCGCEHPPQWWTAEQLAEIA